MFFFRNKNLINKVKEVEAQLESENMNGISSLAELRQEIKFLKGVNTKLEKK